MANTLRLNKYLPDIVRILGRFPVPMVAAIALFLFFNLVLIGSKGGDFPENIVAAGVAAFLAGGAGHLFAEASAWSKARNNGIAVLIGAAAAAVPFFARDLGTSWQFLLAGLTIVLFVSTGLARNASQSALWLFGFRLLQAATLAVLAGVIFSGGLSAVTAGLDFLLGFDVDREVYQRIWTLGLILVGPLFGLSLVPVNHDQEPAFSPARSGLMENGVFVLVNYVMAPLVLVYAAILHAYALKILWLNSLPRGEIGTLVSLFALAGTVTWLIAWPWRETGDRLLKRFMQHWFWLIPMPAILLAIGITRRIADYGVTPDRYALALVTIWTIIVFAYLTLRRSYADIRFVLGSAAVLLVLGAFGPWGANSMTERTQLSRLERILVERGVFKNGEVDIRTPLKSEHKSSEAVSIIRTLGSIDALNGIDKWFKHGVHASTGNSWETQNNYAAALGISLNSTSSDRVQFLAVKPIDYALAGNHRLMGPYTYRPGRDKEAPPDAVTVSATLDSLVISVGSSKFEITKQSLIEQFRENSSEKTSQAQPREVSLDEGTRLLVTQAYATAGSENRIDELQFWIIQRQ